MRYSLLVFVLGFCNAFAVNDPPREVSDGDSVVISPVVGSSANSTSDAFAKAAAQAAAGAFANIQLTDASTTTSDVSTGDIAVQVEGSDTYVEGSTINIEGDSTKYRQRLQAPSVSAPPAYPTSPCIVGVSGGLTVPGFGISGARGIEDDECTLRETARLFYEFEERRTAINLLCTSGVFRDSGVECPRPPPIKEIRYDNTSCETKLERCTNTFRKPGAK